MKTTLAGIEYTRIRDNFWTYDGEHCSIPIQGRMAVSDPNLLASLEVIYGMVELFDGLLEDYEEAATQHGLSYYEQRRDWWLDLRWPEEYTDNV